jgi:hypothetical protein
MNEHLWLVRTLLIFAAKLPIDDVMQITRSETVADFYLESVFSDPAKTVARWKERLDSLGIHWHEFRYPASLRA